MRKLTFIIGGARSGKSAHAERLAEQGRGQVLYIATAQPLDEEMRSRIAAHRQRRSIQWQTLELPTDVGKHVLAHPQHAEVVVLDCLTLLVSNRLLQAAPDANHPAEITARLMVEQEVETLLKAIEASRSHWLVVSNEVGQGVVPAYPMGRLFRDMLGWANKQMAKRADEVLWMVAGIPVPIGQHRGAATDSEHKGHQEQEGKNKGTLPSL
ncbi:MAG: bifunctional adenosylcobinamide kinase/adenosylcobinamide-phosphate guanylyltransferase [Chloroflexota bacterium]